jgi:predicted MFS family arabinose efflux permease
VATSSLVEVPFEPGMSRESSWAYPGWKVAIASSFACMAGFGSILIYSFGAFIKPLSAEFGWSRQTIATAFACASFTLGLCSPVLGLLLDRFGPRRVLLPCIALFALAFGSLSTLHKSLPQLFCTFIMIGAIGNATAQLGYTRAVSTWFHDRRGAALAVLLTGSSLGMVAVPILAQGLITAVGWRMSYIVLGSLPLLIAFPIAALFVRERKEEGETTGKAAATPLDSSALKSRAFWILLATLVLGAMSTTGVITQLSALLTDRGIKPSGAGYAVAAAGAASFGGRLSTGWLLDRFFAPRVGMLLLFTTSMGLYLLKTAATLPTALVAAVLIGFSMGGESDVTPYVLARYFGLKSLGLLYGWAWMAFAIAAAVGSILLGRAFDHSGTYIGVLQLFSVATFVAGALMLAMPRYPDTVTRFPLR